MRPLFAFLCPPIAVLMCGKWFQGLFISPILTACFWISGSFTPGWSSIAGRKRTGRMSCLWPPRSRPSWRTLVGRGE